MEKRLDTILSLELPYQETLTLRRSVYRGGAGPRVAVTAGIHGNELEGLYLCHRLAAWLEELGRTRPEALLGQVELYPALNPLGLDTLQRTVPVYDSDLERAFPGHAGGLLPQRIAATVMAQLQGAALVIDIHASDIYQQEAPQVRIDRRFAATLVPLARHLNLDVIWLQEAVRVLETTLTYSLNTRGEPCLLLVLGTGMGLTHKYTERLLTGILKLWQRLGALAPDLELSSPEYPPVLVEDAQVCCLNAETSGLFVAPRAECGLRVTPGQVLGLIVSPFEGRVLAEIRAPVDGMVFTLRHYPLVYEGSLLARIAATPLSFGITA
jgi:predicted deacylase